MLDFTEWATWSQTLWSRICAGTSTSLSWSQYRQLQTSQCQCHGSWWHVPGLFICPTSRRRFFMTGIQGHKWIRHFGCHMTCTGGCYMTCIGGCHMTCTGGCHMTWRKLKLVVMWLLLFKVWFIDTYHCVGQETHLKLIVIYKTNCLSVIIVLLQYELIYYAATEIVHNNK